MNGKVSFILGVHSHLPNGVPEEDFETLYQSKIRPLVSALYQFPAINVVFHYSGVLFHWMERRHPELLVLIEDLLGRKQAELLGGGFYEPVMPLLPPADRIGQIEMLTTYLRKQFGRRPQGCLFSRAWEQNLVGPLSSCGMNYAFLDESYFAASGAIKKGQFFEPCITEDQGKIITVFPISSSLSTTKPAAMLEKITLPENSGSPEPGPVTVFPIFNVDPGEKAETEYQNFFEELSGADSRVEFTTPARVFKNLRGLEKLYFAGYPTAQQELPPRQFLTAYPEAGNLYAKMIHTRVLINQLRGDKTRKQTALEELWKAQDSTLFSARGLETAPVRKAAYRALIAAEQITREKGAFTPSISVFDYDLDGEDEYVFRDEKLNCYIKTRGAGLFELDYLPKTWNCLDIYNPAAHGKEARAFIDHLVPGTTMPPPNSPAIEGTRFLGNEIFEPPELARLKKHAQFYLPPKPGIPLGEISVKKTWSLKKNVLSLQYELENTSSAHQDFILVPALNLSFSGGTDDTLKVFCLRQNTRDPAPAKDTAETTLKELTGLEFRDIKHEIVLTLESSRAFDAAIFHVRAIQTDAVVDAALEYRYTRVHPALPITLEPGKTWETVFTLKINS